MKFGIFFAKKMSTNNNWKEGKTFDLKKLQNLKMLDLLFVKAKGMTKENEYKGIFNEICRMQLDVVANGISVKWLKVE